MRFLPVPVILALLALLLALPTTALAQAEPDMMEDPVEAMEPEIEVAAEEPAMPEVEGMVEANVVEPAAALEPAADAEAGAVDAPAYTATAGSGQLPFTGMDSRQLVLLFLVGSVLVSGGIVSIAWGRALSATA